MELAIVREGDTLPPGPAAALSRPGGGVHEDILMGRDTEIGWEDVYAGQDGARTDVVAGEI